MKLGSHICAGGRMRLPRRFGIWPMTWTREDAAENAPRKREFQKSRPQVQIVPWLRMSGETAPKNESILGPNKEENILLGFSGGVL